MSMTIYGGKTRNDVFINDMIDNNRDTIYPSRNREYFARFSSWEDQPGQGNVQPAIAVFSNSDEFTPIYAKKLDGNHNDYLTKDGYDTNRRFDDKLRECWKEAQEFGINVGYEENVSKNNGKLPFGVENMMQQVQDETQFQ